MTYLDSSVVLAYLLAENDTPHESAFHDAVSSRLTAYEVWTVIHRRKLSRSHGDAAAAFLQRLKFIEMIPSVLSRAMEPFPRPVRTLDALHLASALYLQEHGQKVKVASYDREMVKAAEALGLSTVPM